MKILTKQKLMTDKMKFVIRHHKNNVINAEPSAQVQETSES